MDKDVGKTISETISSLFWELQEITANVEVHWQFQGGCSFNRCLSMWTETIRCGEQWQ